MRVLVFALVGMIACSPYDEDFGSTPFLCGPTEPRCPSGYTCLEDNGREVCFDDGGQSGDENCEDDTGLEPNDELEMASPTGLDAMRTLALDNLTICPGVDKDHYAITVGTTNETIEVSVDFDPDVMLRAAILNEHGIPIAAASAVNGVPTTIRARAQNLPAGGYYVQVAGSGDALATHHYKLAIDITGP